MSEMSEHRVTMLGASWRRFEDPTRSRDPRIRALVSSLATLPGPELRPEFRTELRTQLVAIAPRIIAESARTNAPLADIVPGMAPAGATRVAAQHNDSVFARIRSISIGRPLAVVTSVLTAFVLLLGGAVWMSQKALPGDTLYGLKRASESFELATAGSDTEKARDYLKFAKTRVEEASALLSRAHVSAAGAGPQASGLDSHTANLISSTLASADHDVKSASSLLGAQAIKSKSTSPLDVMTAWAPGQVSRLDAIAAAMPDSALRTRTQSSALLVTAALTRAQDLAPQVASACLDGTVTDELGPTPEGLCTSGSITPPAGGSQTITPGQSTPAGSSAPGGEGSGSGAPQGTSSSSGATSSGSESPTSIIQLPTLLPTSTPTLPVSVDTCGVGATLGPIGIGIGLCSGLHLSLTP
jgi:hypothetical protein